MYHWVKRKAYISGVAKPGKNYTFNFTSCNITKIKKLNHLLWIQWGCTRLWDVTCDFQQCGILTSVDTDEPVQPPFKLRNSKWCLVSSLRVIEFSSDKQKLWSDCAYAQTDLRLCWSHIPHCCKSHVTAHIFHDWQSQERIIHFHFTSWNTWNLHFK